MNKEVTTTNEKLADVLKKEATDKVAHSVFDNAQKSKPLKEITNASVIIEVLKGMDRLLSQMSYFEETIKGMLSDGMFDDHRNSLQCVIEMREETNKGMLDVYRRMIDVLTLEMQTKI